MAIVEDTGTPPELKRTFTRSEAIKIIDDSFDPDYMEEEDRENTQGMSNDELEESLCSSGYIHDEEMGGVIDDEVA